MPGGRRFLGLGDYAEWGEDRRLEWLVRELGSKRPLIPSAMPMSKDVREVRDLFFFFLCK
jgi:phosphoenolpyruvate carboxylase